MSRILVIDDDPSVLRTFQRLLERSGFVVETAQSGRQGLDRARGSGIDLIVADMRLPDLTGIEVLGQLRSENINTPVLIVTAFGSIASALNATRLGAVDYLEKPVTRACLLRAIDLAVASGRLWTIPLPAGASVVELQSAARWAEMVLTLFASARDVKNLTQWSRVVGAAPSTIKSRCRAARVSTKGSLDLARVLRALVLARGTGLPLTTFLDGDPRTLQRLMNGAGLVSVPGSAELLPTPIVVLDRMRSSLDLDPTALGEVRKRLLALG